MCVLIGHVDGHCNDAIFRYSMQRVDRGWKTVDGIPWQSTGEKRIMHQKSCTDAFHYMYDLSIL